MTTIPNLQQRWTAPEITDTFAMLLILFRTTETLCSKPAHVLLFLHTRVINVDRTPTGSINFHNDSRTNESNAAQKSTKHVMAGPWNQWRCFRDIRLVNIWSIQLLPGGKPLYLDRLCAYLDETEILASGGVQSVSAYIDKTNIKGRFNRLQFPS